MDAWLQRVAALRARFRVVELVLFFAAGFLLDAFTLGRIDRPAVLLRQALFLCSLAALLLLEHRFRLALFRPRGRVERAWQYQGEAVHFLFGSLLSNFTLFYFKSSAGLMGRGFLLLLGTLLVVNELPRFRASGQLVRFGLFAFCLGSYLAYLLPVVQGVLRRELYVLAMLLAGCVAAGLVLVMLGWERAAGQRAGAWRQLGVGWGTLAAMYGLYAAGAIPPVPLSVRTLALYNDVDREGSAWVLTRDPVPGEAQGKGWWPARERFHSRAGDRVHVFARVFAPNAFRDRVWVRWQVKEAAGWRTTDRIPFTITGGREDGFAGHAWKQHAWPGLWRVTVETEDGRGVGELEFDLVFD